MYANHRASDDYISNLYESKVKYVWWKIPILFLSITNIVFHVENIDFLKENLLFHVANKSKDYEKVMEDLHKVSVHELNKAFI
jgi:hypothetical protein